MEKLNFHLQICRSKTAYATIAIAQKAARAMNDRGLNVTPYRCPQCYTYHLKTERTLKSAKRKPR